MRHEKKDFYVLLILLGSLFVFYPELFFAKAASLMGDHIDQHYPWAYLLAESIKQFKFPWWTSLIHSGFPIVAEGQIGAFYLPNLILCFLLPIKWAYSYTNLVHFFISGWATYLYVRLMKLSRTSALTASIVFLFGAAYGGAYYNITSLKTIAWFPVSLFFFENFYSSKKMKHLFFLSCSIALSLLAGYFQIAVLALLIFLCYALLRIFIFSEKENDSFKTKFNCVALLTVAIGIALALAFPQLFLTFQLTKLSNRAYLPESYAYVGSMSPLVILTAFFPVMQGFLRGNSLYGGTISIFFILCALFGDFRKTNLFKIWVWVAFISFCFALGRWSPFYVGMIKITHFYLFRMPAKFLVFICFAGAMLTGIGVETIQNYIHSKRTQFPLWKISLVYGGLLSFVILCQIFIYYFMGAGRVLSLKAGEWFVGKFVYGQTGHPYSLEVYSGKLQGALDSIKQMVSFVNPWNIWTYCLFAISFVFMLNLRPGKKEGKKWLLLCFLFLFVDLYAYAWCDIKKDFDTYANIYQPSSIIERLIKEREAGKMERIYSFRNENELLPIIPSSNMLYGFEDIGAYSPLVMQRYHETIGQFGNINDSNLAYTPSQEFLKEHLNILNTLGVSHVLSKQEIKQDHLDLLLYDPQSKTYLYRNQNHHAKAFFVSKVELFPDWLQLKVCFLKARFNPYDVLLLERKELEKISLSDFHTSKNQRATLIRIGQTSDSESWSAQVGQPGFFVLTNMMYPGWTASLNGKTVPILSAYGLFQAVWIEKAGKYEISLKYKPFHQ